MGKKGSWFSAIKRVFIPTSKDKLVDGLDKKDAKEKKKKGEGKLKHGHSLIPLFREPSTIEKILGEAEREHHLIDYRPISPFEQPRTPSFIPSRAATPLQHHVNSQWTPSPQMAASTPRIPSSRRAVSPPRGATPQRVTSPSKGSMSQRMFSAPKASTPQRTVSTSQAATPLNDAIPSRSTSSRYVHQPRPEPTLRYQHMCATRIQAAYRGYAARRSYRSLRGLVRLQGVVKGQNVKRQTVNAMKCMQLLVRVQTQIQSRRIQMLESQATQRQRNDKELESGNGKWNLSQLNENGNADEWDDSRLTKEEIEAKTQRKFEAVMKRERAMAYAYSHQLWKASPKTPQAALMDIRSSGGFPWWWNWLDRTDKNTSTAPTKPSESQAIKNLFSTPPRQTGTSPLMPRASNNYSQQSPGFDHFDTATPRSTRSVAVPSRTKQSPTPPSRFPGNNKIMRPKPTNANHSPFGAHFKDDDSLTSCPPFSVAPSPRYMEHTVSAKAKARGEFEASPDVQPKKRVSFPLAQGIGSFKWNKRGSLFSTTTTPSRERVFKKQSLQSIGNLSVDSTVSMPATVGRKPFNRFV